MFDDDSYLLSDTMLWFPSEEESRKMLEVSKRRLEGQGLQLKKFRRVNYERVLSKFQKLIDPRKFETEKDRREALKQDGPNPLVCVV